MSHVSIAKQGATDDTNLKVRAFPVASYSSMGDKLAQ